jgi:hypothetical protein
MTLLQAVAFSTTLIEAGVPEHEADQITDCVIADRTLESGEAWDDTAASCVSSISCWHDKPWNVWQSAIDAASEADL